MNNPIFHKKLYKGVDVLNDNFLATEVIHKNIAFKINLKSDFKMKTVNKEYLNFTSNKKIHSHTFYGLVTSAEIIDSSVILSVVVDRYIKGNKLHEFPRECLVPTEVGSAYIFVVDLSCIELI